MKRKAVSRTSIGVMLVFLLLLSGCAALTPKATPPPPAVTPTPPPNAKPPPTTVQTGNGSIRGVVESRLWDSIDAPLVPLTAGQGDNPESAQITISGPVPGVTMVDTKGHFLFANLPAGSYQVTASARWYKSWTDTVELSSGEEVELYFLLFKGKGIIKGRIVCAGAGIAKATLQATNVTTGVAEGATYSKADGSYTVEVPAGGYMVFAGAIFNSECSALAKAYNETTHHFVVESGEVVTHDIILQHSLTSLKYDLVMTYPGQPVLAFKMWVKGQNSRGEATQQGQTMVMIVNIDKGVSYMYFPAQNTAFKTEIPMGPTGEKIVALPGGSPVQLSATYAAMGAAVVGTETVDGKESLVIEVKSAGQTMKAWVWKKYGIAIRREMPSPQGTMIIEYNNMDFGNIPDSMFELPAGVKIQQTPGGTPR